MSLRQGRTANRPPERRLAAGRNLGMAPPGVKDERTARGKGFTLRIQGVRYLAVMAGLDPATHACAEAKDGVDAQLDRRA